MNPASGTPTKHPVRTAAVIGALGIVFGDIGTSPLYAFREPLRIAMGGGVPLHDAVLGVLSLIFWALTLTITIKYVTFVLRADNDGEGGDLALVTSLRLHKTKTRRNSLLLIAGLIGTAMLFGDGVITPAISVLSAVEGLQVVAPSIQHWAVHISMAILIAVFMSQRFGTEKIGWLYGPIILVWFVSIGVLGISHILQYPGIFAALSPHFAWNLMTHHPALTAAVIGAVILAVTGGEALYVDMGHFGRNVVRAAWFFVAMPGLLLNYFGQGALMLSSGGAVTNPFFELAPEWFGLPLLVLATLATIVASQAIITGAFSVARQTIEIGYFPPMRIKGTSERNSLHVYIPRLSVALMTLTLLVIVYFQTSSNLASAYGVAVSVAMMMTTILFSAWMLQKSRWPKFLVGLLCTLFLCLDIMFVVTNLSKIADGGWLPLVMGGFVLTCMISWHRGLENITQRHLEYTEPITEFAARIARAPLATVNHTGIFFSRTGIMAPVPLERLADMLHVKFERTIIISIRIASRPRVTAAERLSVTEIDTSTLKIEVRYGYQQIINIPATIGPTLAEYGIDADEALYIIGHERVIGPMEPSSMFDLMNVLFAFLAATAERAVDRFQLPPSRTLEFGYPVQLQDR